MTVISENREYRILRRLKSDGGQTAYTARSAGAMVLLLKVTDSETVRDAEVYFTSPETERFTGLLEVFRRGSSLWLAFDYPRPDAVRLEKAARGEADLSSRNRLALELVGAVKALPWPVACDVLRPGRVFTAHDEALTAHGRAGGGTVGFLYLLGLRPGYGRDCRAAAMSLLADCLTLIYGDCGYPAVSLFIDALRAMEYPGMDEIHGAFVSNVYRPIANMPVPLPDNTKPSLAERIRKLSGVSELIAKALAVVLLIIGYVTLGRSLYNAVVNPPMTGDITAIGTVRLYED